MGVLSVTPAQQAANGSVKKSGARSYTAPYVVAVEYATDGPVAILNYFRDNGPWVGDTFAYGNESDTTVLCTGIAPQRLAKSTNKWLVTATYEEPDSQEEKKDHEGNPSEDPSQWRMNVQSQTATFSVPVWKAWNIDPFPVDGKSSSFTRSADTLGPVVNSAGVVLDPPLMTEDSENVLRVTGYQDALVQVWLDDYVNKINGTPLIWNETLKKWYGVEADAFEPYEVKCSAANASVKWWRDLVYYQYDYEFRIRRRAADDDDPVDGWLVSVLDRGVSKRAGAGDPDGFGGTISASDLEDGMARVSPILDVNGRRQPELILLDGAGQPATGADERAGVFFRWRVHPIEDFSSMPIPIFASP